MIMITVTILALVLAYKSFCNTVFIYMVMQIKLVVVVVVVYGEASPERGPVFRPQAYISRVRISQVEVYKRVGKSDISELF